VTICTQLNSRLPSQDLKTGTTEVVLVSWHCSALLGFFDHDATTVLYEARIGGWTEIMMLVHDRESATRYMFALVSEDMVDCTPWAAKAKIQDNASQYTKIPISCQQNLGHRVHQDLSNVRGC